MDFSKIKVPIAVVGLIIAQAFGIIWYVAQLDSTVTNLDTTVAEMQVFMTDIDNRLDEIEKTQAIIDNEMRTIMSDHSCFADALNDLRQSGILPSGEKREYGGYGN